ncbi:MAG: DNA adenine methylase [Ignavibacteriales bacterium]|nr:DNA adenine methylase [Ignavibacteriales bacterium]
MRTDALFDDIVIEAPETEGVKYIGSKMKLLPFILELAKKTDARTVLDGFSGTTRVSQALACVGYKVVANDIAVWSEVFGRCYLQANRERKEYNDLIGHLNSVKPIDGWFSEKYGGLSNAGSSVQEDGYKRIWQIHNTRKLDAVREEIERLSLSPVDKSVALTSLILALDRVDNTLGHYAAYLQSWSPRSYNNLVLKVPKIVLSGEKHEVTRENIFHIIKKSDFDLAYFDPPYGSNNDKMPPSRVRYASYYHIWTTICLNDTPVLFGKANRRKDTSDVVSTSIFEEFRLNENGKFVAVEAIKRLIRETRARFILLSYSSGGRATAEELNEVLTETGRIVETIELDYRKNVMASMKWTNEWLRDSEQPNREFLFLLEKT